MASKKPGKDFRDDPLFKKGMRVRKAVLGLAHLGNRISQANEYTQGFEEFSTKAAWGLVWSRPGLSRRIRSFLNIAMHIGVSNSSRIARLAFKIESNSFAATLEYMSI